MNKIYIILSKNIKKELIDNEYYIDNLLKEKFELNLTNVPTPLHEMNKSRDIITFIDTINTLIDIYEILEYIKDIIKLINMTQSRYLKIYNKDKKVKKIINLDDEDYIDQIKKVLEESTEYIFEFITSEES